MNWLLHGVGLWIMCGIAVVGWIALALFIGRLLNNQWRLRTPPHYPDDCDACRWNQDRIE